MKKFAILLMGLGCSAVMAANVDTSGINAAKEVLLHASSLGEQPVSDVDAMNFIMDMYNNRNFENYQYLEAHSTPHLLRKLADSYEYDCEPGDQCYDVASFRSGVQDGPAEKNYVTHIQPLGNGWYEYHYYDMGLKSSNKVKIIQKNGKLYFDDVQRDDEQ
jgi:hypothetical protein